eukprot:scaffold5545_cov111-Isochrysis_galbana.AAC.14
MKPVEHLKGRRMLRGAPATARNKTLPRSRSGGWYGAHLAGLGTGAAACAERGWAAICEGANI